MAKIEFLGRLSDSCGPAKDIRISDDIKDVANLRKWLNTQLDEEPLSARNIRAIVNGAIVSEEHLISNSDIIAFFPPVGGG